MAEPENRLLRPYFTSNLVHGLAFGTTNFYIAPDGEINHELLNLSYNYDVNSGLSISDEPLCDFCCKESSYSSNYACPDS